ncbi:MAG TPA: hypothetical protein VK935_17280 [Actinomycetospora sp.]|nr:hypothetical protein [Actinomycetospora sp.]
MAHRISGAPPSPRVDADVTYLLLHNGEDIVASPESTRRHAGPGWTVLASHASRWSWMIRLDAHGAAPGAPTRVAQAVAVRVLGDHAIDVAGWQPAEPPGTAYVAVIAPQLVPRQRRGPSRWWR